MKIEAYGYEHDPHVSLLLVPETDVEKSLLASLWKHGRLTMTYCGFAITSRDNRADEVKKP
jgi:hypothetical protein